MNEDQLQEKPKKRDLVEVIEKMMACIPKNSKTQMPFKADLEKILESSKYSSPEMETYRWHQVAAVVNRNVPSNPKKLNKWQRKLVEIWIDGKLEI